MRISKKDKAEYNRLKRNVKAKLRNTQKKHGLDLSGLIELPDLNSFTRKDFNLWKEQAQKFTKSPANKVKYNEFGVPYTAKLVNEYKKRAEKSNEVKEEFNKKHEHLPYMVSGKESGMTVGQMKLMKAPDPLGNRTKNEFDISKIKSIRDLERKMNKIDKQQDEKHYHTTLEDMKSNWLVAVAGSFNDEADDLIELVRGLSPELFYEVYQQIAEMDFENYDSEGQEVGATEKQVELIENSIVSYLRGDTPAPLLKNFPNRW